MWYTDDPISPAFFYFCLKYSIDTYVQISLSRSITIVLIQSIKKLQNGRMFNLCRRKRVVCLKCHLRTYLQILPINLRIRNMVSIVLPVAHQIWLQRDMKQ
jgi:hypothetical protein